jgi:hypothetical protein
MRAAHLRQSYGGSGVHFGPPKPWRRWRRPRSDVVAADTKNRRAILRVRSTAVFGEAGTSLRAIDQAVKANLWRTDAKGCRTKRQQTGSRVAQGMPSHERRRSLCQRRRSELRLTAGVLPPHRLTKVLTSRIRPNSVLAQIFPDIDSNNRRLDCRFFVGRLCC